MQLLVKCYDKIIAWSKHEHAPRYLAAISFIEASVFPISPIFMMTPMAIARPQKAYDYAFIATFSSVAGGLLGYLLGYFVFQPLVMPLIETFNLMPIYDRVWHLITEYGFWAVMFAGFTPIPFKFVAIGAGFMHVPLMPFVLASLIGRSVKFYILATLIRIGGARIETTIRALLNKAGLFVVCLGAVIFGCKAFGVI